MRPQLAVATDDTPEHNTGKLKVISFWSGPGAGKSTIAAGLFNLMKREGMSVENVSEYAKDLTYEQSFSKLQNQTLILAKQEGKLRRLIDKVEYVITDSPFPLGLIYGAKDWARKAEPLVNKLWDDYEHFAFRLHRTAGTWKSEGRNEDLETAISLDAPIYDLAVDYGAGEFPVINGHSTTAEYEVLDYVRVASGLEPLSAKYKRDYYLDMKPKGLPSDVVITTLINGEQLVGPRDAGARLRPSNWPLNKYAPGGGDDI